MSAVASPPGFAVSPGEGNLPRLTLAAPDGATAEVYLYGAHVASWIPSGDEERLFLSRASAFRAGAPIRGGVPLIFPQFGLTGPLPLHGLIRLMTWEFAGAHTTGDAAVASFRVADNEASRRLWPHAFLAEVMITIGGRRLTLALDVSNAGAEVFSFTAGFHTYFAISNLDATRVEGLMGAHYRDNVAGGEADQTLPVVEFPGEVNRIYLDAPAELRLVEADRTTLIRSTGFPDAVVWNPGAARIATMVDLEPNDYRRFVCVEAVCIGRPVTLAPGQHWQGTQTMLA